MNGEHEAVERTESTVWTWASAFAEVERRLGPSFARAEARQQAMAYLRGLLSPIERKNSWQLAEAGRWRAISRQRKGRWGWTTMRYGAGSGGTAISR